MLNDCMFYSQKLATIGSFVLPSLELPWYLTSISYLELFINRIETIYINQLLLIHLKRFIHVNIISNSFSLCAFIDSIVLFWISQSHLHRKSQCICHLSLTSAFRHSCAFLTFYLNDYWFCVVAAKNNKLRKSLYTLCWYNSKNR